MAGEDGCKAFLALLGSYLDGEVPALGAAECDAHLAACPPCRRFFDSCCVTIRVYRLQPPPPIPAALHRKVMDRLHQGRPPLGPGANLSR